MKLIYLLITFLIYSSMSVQSDIALPDSISPQMYNVVLSVSSNLATRRFSGSVVLTFRALESVSEIWLNSRRHSQMEATVFDSFDNFVSSGNVTRENDDVVRVTLSSQLTANETYQILLLYSGNLMINPDGFFRSSYFVVEGGIERFIWQAATNFNSHSARHAFPCFDNPKYRANFQLTIEHGSGFDAISNAPAMSRVNLPSGVVRTNFRYVDAIPPQSLAFFLMSTERFSRQTKNVTRNGFEHSVSTRATEKAFTEKFINSLEVLVTRVELFLNTSMPNEFSHHRHVALPDFQLVGAYYGFNFYPEHLILFNPVISPQTKEFSIRRMIATGLLSQFLGNIVTLTSYDDAWIFNGLTKFLEYKIATITSDDDDFASSDEIFINEILHTTLHHQRLLQNSSQQEDEKAACIFHMIYRAIGGKVFSMALHRLIAENSYASITAKVFFDTLQTAHEEDSDLRFYGDLENVIRGFMNVNDQVVVIAFVSNNGNLLNVIKSSITMPINFITSKMESPSVIAWSERTHEMTPLDPLDDKDWLLVNVDRVGFYRVNYDETNWRRLTSSIKQQRDAFSNQTIAQLIDDSLSFARDSLLSYRIVLDLMEILKNESSIIVWNAASLNLLELNNRVRDLDFHQHFMEFIHEMSLHYMKTIGFDDLAEELLMDKFSRLQMIDFTCRMNSDECLSKMYASLVSYLDNGEKLPVNLEASIFCYGLMAAANNDEFDYFRQLYTEMQESQETEFRLKIIDALGCYENSTSLFSYMETITFGENGARYRPNEYLQVIQSAYSKTSAGIRAVINFLTLYARTAATRTQTPNLVEVVVADIAPRIFDDELFKELVAMMTQLNVTEKVVESATEIVGKNIAWKSSSAANDIHEWLENRANPSTPTESTDSTTSIGPSTPPTTTTSTSTTTTTEQPILPSSSNRLNSLKTLILILSFISVAFFLNQ